MHSGMNTCCSSFRACSWVYFLSATHRDTSAGDSKRRQRQATEDAGAQLPEGHGGRRGREGLGGSGEPRRRAGQACRPSESPAGSPSTLRSSGQAAHLARPGKRGPGFMEEEEAPAVVQLAAVWLSSGPSGHMGSSPRPPRLFRLLRSSQHSLIPTSTSSLPA